MTSSVSLYCKTHNQEIIASFMLRNEFNTVPRARQHHKLFKDSKLKSSMFYQIVPLRDIVATQRPLELDIYFNVREACRGGRPAPLMEAWNYSAQYGKIRFESVGSRDLASALIAFEDSLRGYDRPTGLILHTYRLDEKEQQKVIGSIGAPLVALMTEPPAARPHSTGSRRIIMGGFEIEIGGRRSISVMM